MEEIARPIAKASSKSKRKIQIFLKRNGQVDRKHEMDIWKRKSNHDEIRTHNPNKVLAKPNSKPMEGA